MTLVTKFLNESEAEVKLPLMKEANHKWLILAPKPYGRNFYDFKNRNDKDLYARYDLIRFIKDETTKMGYKVQMHVRDGWKEPKNPGLTLVVENFGGDVDHTVSTPDWGIPAPVGLRLVFYDISPYDFIAETAKIEITKETVEMIPDPYEVGGYREFRRGGGSKKTKRSVEELIVIKTARKGKNQDMSYESEQEIKEFKQQEKEKKTMKK